MDNRLTTWWVFLLISLFVSPLYAQNNKTFNIELIIFSQDMPSSEIFEQYESKIGWPAQLTKLRQYQQLPKELQSLNKIYLNLRYASGYHPLLHVAWTQKIDADSQGDAVSLSDSEGRIYGYFRLQRGHYLYLITDLEFNQGDQIYRLNEKRRIKFNEIHYLDHPKFGVIAKVSPPS